MQKVICLTFLAWGFFLPFSILAQSSSEVGLFFGGSIYYGELSKKHGTLEEIGMVGGVRGHYMFNRKMGIKAIIAYAQLMGRDETAGIHLDRGWAFENEIIEASLQFEYHPLGKGRRNIVGMFNDGEWSPYLLFGGGIAYGPPTVFTPPKDESKFPEQENPQSLFVVAPIGIGIRYDAGEYSIFHLEFGKRAVFSDYIDGISLNGNSATNDWYAFLTLGYSILLDAQIDRRF